jgi:hypothetical protein
MDAYDYQPPMPNKVATLQLKMKEKNPHDDLQHSLAG